MTTHPETTVIENAPWILHDRLVAEELKWLSEVTEVMTTLKINKFPTGKQFISLNKKTLHTQIQNFCGKKLFCEMYNIPC